MLVREVPPRKEETVRDKSEKKGRTLGDITRCRQGIDPSGQRDTCKNGVDDEGAACRRDSSGPGRDPREDGAAWMTVDVVRCQVEESLNCGVARQCHSLERNAVVNWKKKWQGRGRGWRGRAKSKTWSACCKMANCVTERVRRRRRRHRNARQWRQLNCSPTPKHWRGWQARTRRGRGRRRRNKGGQRSRCTFCSSLSLLAPTGLIR